MSTGIMPATIIINIQTGLIEEITGFDPNAGIIATGCLIYPGFVDIHVHGREDMTGYQNYKEDFESLGEAAINGGVVAVAAMPNTPEPPVTEMIYLDVLGLTKKSRIDILPYGAIAPGSRPFANLHVPFKTFLAESVNNLKFSSEDEARETLRHYRDKHVSLHCDSNDILAECEGESTHEKRRPEASEIQAISFALKLAERYRFFLKVVHCSTYAGLLSIEHARDRGQRVLCEATPTHCYADRSILKDAPIETRRKWQMNPPLRYAFNREYICRGLRTGKVNFLASDHAPHKLREKGLEPDQLINSDVNVMSGTTQLDTYGPFTTWLMHEQGFSPLDILRIAAENPGEWYSQFLPRINRNGLGYGKIAKGYIGSLTIIHPSSPMTVSRENLKTKCGWSPFEGVTFPGSVQYTIVRGKVLKSP
jgi:dihydroorotase